MTWFFAVIVVAVMGGIAVVAAGAGGSMAESFDDRPDARVPADGPLTAADLRRVRFSTAVRGYRMSEVDALLDRLAAEREPRHEPRPDDGTRPVTTLRRTTARDLRCAPASSGPSTSTSPPTRSGGTSPTGRARTSGSRRPGWRTSTTPAAWAAGSGPGAASARSASGTR